VFLNVKSERSPLKLGSFPKLTMRYYGPFEILEKIGLVFYMTTLPASMRIHNVFHVSLLKKYVNDRNHVTGWNVIQVEHEGYFQVEPVHILDQKAKFLRKKSINLVMVQWTCYSPEDTTWEHEESVWKAYPQCFAYFKENLMYICT
jgi:hypothetical protein